MAGIGYAFISAYLKGEEARMVTSEHLNALTKITGYQEAVDTIRDTDIGSYLEELDVTSFDELDEHIWSYFNASVSRITWFNGIPGDLKAIVALYTQKYDILNIKTALQNILNNTRANGIPAGEIYQNNYLEKMLEAENMDDILSVMNACKLTDFTPVLEYYRNEDGISKSVLTDTGLETLYYSRLIEAVKKVKDSAALLKAIYTIIDMANLQVTMRAVMSESETDATGRTIEGGYILSASLIRELLTLKPSDIPQRMEYAEYRSIIEELLSNYEKDNNVSSIDETIEKRKFQMIRDILSPRIMSPVVAVWYILLKELEIRNVRLVLKAALDNIPQDEIKDYLVYSS